MISDNFEESDMKYKFIITLTVVIKRVKYSVVVIIHCEKFY